MSKAHASAYSITLTPVSQEENRFRAANGSKVDISGSAHVPVWITFADGGSSQANLRCLVGNISHNILSTTTLCSCGWEFVQDANSCWLKHAQTGRHVCDVVFYGGCPWVKLDPVEQSGWTPGEHTCEDSGAKVSALNFSCFAPLTRGSEAALEQHRLQGHTPFDPRCVICARGKTVFQRRKRTPDRLETEIQADFAFLTKRGELLEDDVNTEGCFKVLVLTEVFTGCVGYVMVTDNGHVKTLVEKWLMHFGLTSQETSIILVTDAEKAVGELVGTSTAKFTFQIRRANPQQHRSVGAAERTVRKLKEPLSCVRADMNSGGVDVIFQPSALADLLTYLALSHNHFGKSHGSNLSPLEFSSQRSLSKPPAALFGQTVLAELPDALRAQSPNETRNIEAAFVHFGLETGPLVQGVLRVDGELMMKRFTARNMKPILPVAWDASIGDKLFCKLEDDDQGSGVPLPLPARAAPMPAQPSSLDDGHPSAMRPAGSANADEMDADTRSPRRDVGDEGEVIEYPEGAPGWLVREMKEPDTTRLPPKKRPPEGPRPKQGALKIARAVEVKHGHPPPASTTASEHVAVTPSVEVPPSSVDVPSREFPKTPQCPACEMGMDVPGCRHTAARKRKRLEFDRESRSVDVETMDMDSGHPTPVGADWFKGRKRLPDVDVKDLEEELREERAQVVPRTLDLFLMDEASTEVDPLDATLELGLMRCSATNGDVYDPTFNSVAFTPGSSGHQCVRVELGKSQVLVWKPDEIIDDSSLLQLDVDLGFLGMQEELQNLERCKAGKVMDQTQIDALKRKHQNMRIIPSRWVAAYKSETRVRTRIVAKDLKKGATARNLGISSPTPSVEGLHFVLSLCSIFSLRLLGLDVDHAFMHSPLPPGCWIAFRLPLSISLTNGEVAFLLLDKALNGLRDASMHWLQVLTNAIKKIGLRSDENEPCIFQGILRGKLAILIVYVDDLLLCCADKGTEDMVIAAIQRVVPLKRTGAVLTADDGGGSLTFIGRTITRMPGTDNAVLLGVNPRFLDVTFAEYNITKGTQTWPDIGAIMDRNLENKQKLTPEAYSKFRRALGKLLWLAQTRHDLKLPLSLIGSQQADPTHGTETAMRALLRFAFQDMDQVLRLPSALYEDNLMTEGSQHCVLHSFSDASHGGYRFNGRRGITGGATFANGSLVRTVARQQQSVSLSSCEAELYALQLVSQEAVAFAKFCARVYDGLLMPVAQPPLILLESDSSAAIQLLCSQDIPKRSRHVEIRLAWLKSKLESKELQIRHREGVQNCADMFTKCLGTRDFQRHRASLGFEKMDMPSMDLLFNSLVGRGQDIALVEVCCSEVSALRDACNVARVPYLGVSARMQDNDIFKRVKEYAQVQREMNKRWIHVHVSTPCTTGSPLRHFHGDRPTQADVEWEPIMSCVLKYLALGDSRSFELPKNNQIWQRDMTQKVLMDSGMDFSADVSLCQTGLRSAEGLPVGKVLVFRCNLDGFTTYLTKKFGSCKCATHANLMQVKWPDTGFYTKELAKGLLAAIRSGRRKC